MFEQTFVEGVGKTNKTWTVLVSFISQILLIGVAIMIPLIYFEALPQSQLTAFFVAPPPPPPPPPPPAAAPVKVVKVIPRQFDAGKLMAPKAIPKDIAIIKEEELPPPRAVAGRGWRRARRRARRRRRRRDRRHYRFGSDRGAAAASSSSEGGRESRHAATNPRGRQRAGRPSWFASPSRSIRRWPSRRAFRVWSGSTPSSAKMARSRT